MSQNGRKQIIESALPTLQRRQGKFLSDEIYHVIVAIVIILISGHPSLKSHASSHSDKRRKIRVIPRACADFAYRLATNGDCHMGLRLRAFWDR